MRAMPLGVGFLFCDFCHWDVCYPSAITPIAKGRNTFCFVSMKHYICTGGCKGVSQNPGNCETSTCLLYGQPLEKCTCEDGKHGGAFEEEDIEFEEGKDE